MVRTMWRRASPIAIAALAVCATPAAFARDADAPARSRSVAAHVGFLASDALQGRGSATRDEAIAAAYVAAQFRSNGLTTAPGMTGYFQTATIVTPRLPAPASLTAGGRRFASMTLPVADSDVAGTLVVTGTAGPAALPRASVLLVTDPGVRVGALRKAAAARGIALLIVPAAAMGSRPGAAPRPTQMAEYIEGIARDPAVAVATLDPADLAALATMAGTRVELRLPPIARTTRTATSAIGFLAGRDPNAGVILVSAHLDHLGIVDGHVMPGANDDASGVAAVLEIARTLAAGARPRRGILFVTYGAEEIGGYGATPFAAAPPVPLTRIVADIEFEMIGAHDPGLKPDRLMLTGYERSTLGPMLAAHGAPLERDPYPQEHFFERSDNYQLALRGVVAHTVSGWATNPTYHDSGDTVAALDLPFLTAAIASMIAPIRWLAETRQIPRWHPGARPRP